MTFETQNSDLSYHDQRLIRLPCGEKILKIYPMVVLEFDVKLRVVFLFAFSIYIYIYSTVRSILSKLYMVYLLPFFLINFTHHDLKNRNSAAES